MGKKNRQVGYDRERLRNLANCLAKFRQPLEEGGFPVKNIDVSELEKAIWELPNKERKSLESFWGLLPGTIDHSKHMNSKKADLAYQNMWNATVDVLRTLLSIEYVCMYEKHAQELISKYLTKVNRSGVENISDIDTIKYVLIFWIFFSNGPKMLFEQADTEINSRYDAIAHLDEYSLLIATWEDIVKDLPDKSINLKLLIEAINMFDVKDVCTMKKFVRLPISKDDSELVTQSFETFRQIRLFKEKIFPHGEWDITDQLILGYKMDEINMEELSDVFCALYSDWRKVEEYRNGTKTVIISKGKLELPAYEFAGLEFTDVDEIMFLCVSISLV